MAAAEATDLALDPALLMRALKTDERELRLEQEMRPQRDKAVGLDAPAALEDLLDGRSQVVVAHQRGTPPRNANASACPSRNACWVSLRNAAANAAPE